MSVGRLGEREIIRRVASRLAAAGRSRNLQLGPGDDAALLAPPAERLLVLTSDLLLEDVHFRRDWTPPRLLGHKALAVNLSDLAAMGADPEVFLLELALPDSWPAADLEAFADGLAAVAERFGVALAGGDTCTGERLHVGITAIGSIAGERVLRRDGGQPGDLLAVTGPLGAAAAGLALLRRGWRLRGDDLQPPPAGAGGLQPRAVRRLLLAHLAPEPEVDAGRWLAGRARAGIDISDGLARDLENLCAASRCGAVLERRQVPVDADAEAAFASLGREAWEAAVEGGEDYRLLVALAADDPAAQGGAAGDPVSLHVVGRLTAAGEGVRVLSEAGEQPLPAGGFRHFRRP